MMIVDDYHKLAFIHIPKCGGTSISRQLRSLDSNREFFKDVRQHPVLGATHFSHLPLYYLREYYSDTFDKVAAYSAFALVRDPYVRFASATLQRLDEFRGYDRIEITSKAAMNEARQVIGWLDGRERFHEAEYMHFSRQSDYVEIDGRPVVRNVFPLENIAELAAAMSEICGLKVDPDRRENTSFSSDSAIIRLARLAKPLYSRMTSWRLRKQILLLMRRLKLQRPSPFYDDVRGDSEIAAFVERFYARDFSILEAARAKVASVAAQPTPHHAAQPRDPARASVRE